MAKINHRVGVTGRIAAVAAIYSLPIVVLLYLVSTNINEFISFARFELDGDTFQRPLEAALGGVQEHQLALHDCHGQASCAPRLAAIEEQVSKALVQLQGVDRRLGSRLQFTMEGLGKRGREHVQIGTVRDEWEALTAGAARVTSEVPADLDGRYDHLAADFRMMITHVGDTSKLILDPDLDSYYLMDVTLLVLPQTQDRLAKMAVSGHNALMRGALTPRDRTDLAVGAALLQEADINRVVGSSQTCLNEDGGFYGRSESLHRNLPTAVAGYKSAAEEFVALTRKVALEEPPSVSAAEYLAAGLKARQASFNAWTTSVGELDVLLDIRVASYENRLCWALGLAAIAVLISSIVAYRVMRSITRPLSKLAKSLGPGATLLRECVARIASGYQSKMTPEQAEIICDELSAHADDVRTAVKELVILVEGREIEEPKAALSVLSGASKRDAA